VFADLKNDFVFRRIFAHHPELTTALLNDLLGLQGDDRIVWLALLSPEQAPIVTGAKLSILDLKARDQRGRTFVVEIQLLHMAGFLNRVVYNASKTFVGQLQAGQPYSSLTDVLALSLCDFPLWPDREGEAPVPLVSRWSMREKVSGREDLLQVQYAFVELPKVAAEGPLRSVAETWAWLFKYGVSLEQIPPGLSRAQEAALQLAEEATFSRDESEAYRRVFDEIQQARELAEEAGRKGEARGKEAGLRAGLRQGEAALREAIGDLCELLGVELTAARQAQLAGLDLAGLQALRSALKSARAWPA
jgi:predicted transposase/invertase (TIGR01784 family)